MKQPNTRCKDFLLANLLPLHAAHGDDPERLYAATDLFLRELALEVGACIGSLDSSPTAALGKFVLYISAGITDGSAYRDTAPAAS